jgi:hypothetical protein
MIKFLSYLVLNGIVAGLLWFGLVEGVQGAQNLGLFAIWVISVMSLFFGTDDIAKVVAKKGFSAPYWFDVLFDLFIVGLLVWHSCYWSGSAYLVHMLMINVLRGNVAKINKGGYDSGASL